MAAKTTKPKSLPPMLPAERCDHCKVAQSLVRWENQIGHTLQFCKHHSDLHEINMKVQGFKIETDISHILTSPSAAPVLVEEADEEDDSDDDWEEVES
jgi:hypothetical protein